MRTVTEVVAVEASAEVGAILGWEVMKKSIIKTEKPSKINIAIGMVFHSIFLKIFPIKKFTADIIII